MMPPSSAHNSLVKVAFVVTANFNIHLLKPVKKGRLTAKGKVKTRAGKQIIAEAVLYDSDDNKIAMGCGSFIKSTTQLTKDIGYQ